jgi:hypothetical protein
LMRCFAVVCNVLIKFTSEVAAPLGVQRNLNLFSSSRY